MGARIDGLVQQRLAKLQAIRQRGIDPYPHRCRRTHTTKEAIALFEQRQGAGDDVLQVSLCGRIMAYRLMGKATFVDIRDGSGKIQAYFRADLLGEARYELLHSWASL